EDDVRCEKLRRWLKVLAIRADCRAGRRRTEMSREAIPHAHRSGERSRGATRGEDPDRRQWHALRNDTHGGKWMVGWKLPGRQREHRPRLLGKQLSVERPQRT